MIDDKDLLEIDRLLAPLTLNNMQARLSWSKLKAKIALANLVEAMPALHDEYSDTITLNLTANGKWDVLRWVDEESCDLLSDSADASEDFAGAHETAKSALLHAFETFKILESERGNRDKGN